MHKHSRVFLNFVLSKLAIVSEGDPFTGMDAASLLQKTCNVAGQGYLIYWKLYHYAVALMTVFPGLHPLRMSIEDFAPSELREKPSRLAMRLEMRRNMKRPWKVAKDTTRPPKRNRIQCNFYTRGGNISSNAMDNNIL